MSADLEEERLRVEKERLAVEKERLRIEKARLNAQRRHRAVYTYYYQPSISSRIGAFIDDIFG